MDDGSNHASKINFAPYVSRAGNLLSNASTTPSPVPRPERFAKGQRSGVASSSTPTSVISKTPKKRPHLAKGNPPAKLSIKRSPSGKHRQDTERSIIEHVTTQAGLEAQDVVTRKESPWDSFRKVYELKIDCFITVAIRTDHSHELVIVKAIPEQEAAGKIAMLQQARHDKFLEVLECFSFENSRHVVFEHIPISLAQVVASPPYPTERELAAILGQIIDGLSFLESRGLEHGSLECSNVLINSEGVIKISGHECCQKIDTSTRTACDIRALGHITMVLLQKYPQENGRIGLENLDRLPSNSKAVDFLSMTTSVTSVKELSKHALLDCHWRAEELKWIVALTAATVRRQFKYSH